MKKIITIIIVIVIAIIILVLRRGGGESSVKSTPAPAGEPALEASTGPKTGTQVGDLAPDFELTDYNGKTVKLSDYRGKQAVFVNFWASWCPFCVDELPLMARVQKQFNGKYATLAVNRGEDQSTGQKFTDKLGVTNAFVLLNDKSDTTYKRYGGFAMPYSLFIDKDGIIHDTKLGPMIEPELIEKINKILE